MTPPTTTGTVQFNDGTTALGTPVPLVGGTALLVTSTLRKGTHSLTAVFTPTDPMAFSPSSSPPVSLTVTGKFPQPITINVHNLIQSIRANVQNLIQSIRGGLHP